MTRSVTEVLEAIANGTAFNPAQLASTCLREMERATPFAMVPVFQQIDKIPGGDCFSACVATVLGLRLEDVPHFCESEDPKDPMWFPAFRSWLLERGLSACVYNWKTREYPPQGMVGACLVSVQSKHPDAKPGWLHSVVGVSHLDKDGRMTLDLVHDPNSRRRESEWSADDIHDVIWIVRVAAGTDARLIAAAPSLLAACKALMYCVEEQKVRPGIHETMTAARAAIAQAEGRA